MSIDPLKLYNILKDKDISFFTGVPDSLLKQFCLCLDDKIKSENHIISANEGNAIALAAGYHLATGKLPVVYMQNSGLGNAVNPLLSLCDSDVYAIPMLLFIGWRGEPGTHDEPQHIKQGKIQEDLLTVIDVPYAVMPKDDSTLNKIINEGIDQALLKSRPFAFLVKKGTFHTFNGHQKQFDENLISRENALKKILGLLSNDFIVVSTTGKTSREIFEIRKENNHNHDSDFLSVGSMGHCLSIALGIALAKPHKKVICIDGDGSLIMHMGGLSTIGNVKPKNLYHILINNYVHESVGGQATSAKSIDIPLLAKSNGYIEVSSVKRESDINGKIKKTLQSDGPVFLEIITKPGSRENLGRPTIRPIDNKLGFMKFIQKK